MYTRHTTTVCSSATLPLPLPLSTYRTRTAFLRFSAVPVVFLIFVWEFSVWSYTGCPLLLLFGLFTVTPVMLFGGSAAVFSCDVQDP